MAAVLPFIRKGVHFKLPGDSAGSILKHWQKNSKGLFCLRAYRWFHIESRTGSEKLKFTDCRCEESHSGQRRPLISWASFICCFMSFFLVSIKLTFLICVVRSSLLLYKSIIYVQIGIPFSQKGAFVFRVSVGNGKTFYGLLIKYVLFIYEQDTIHVYKH